MPGNSKIDLLLALNAWFPSPGLTSSHPELTEKRGSAWSQPGRTQKHRAAAGGAGILAVHVFQNGVMSCSSIARIAKALKQASWADIGLSIKVRSPFHRYGVSPAGCEPGVISDAVTEQELTWVGRRLHMPTR